VKTQHIRKEELKTYKKLFLLINAHLTRYQPGDNVNITGGKKFGDVIAPLFAKLKGRRVESALRLKSVKY